MDDQEKQELKHTLGNVQAENQALKSLLGKAADRLEDVVASQCDEDEQVKALNVAERLRLAVQLSESRDRRSI